jgi:hypothetical protein
VTATAKETMSSALGRKGDLHLGKAVPSLNGGGVFAAQQHITVAVAWVLPHGDRSGANCGTAAFGATQRGVRAGSSRFRVGASIKVI